MHFFYKNIFFFFFFALLQFPLYSYDNVTKSRDEVVAAYIYLLSKNTHWPQEQYLQHFTIAIVEEDNHISEILKKMTHNLKLKNKTIDIVTLHTPHHSSLHNAQVIFVSEKFNAVLEDLYAQIAHKPILLISDNAIDMHATMINLYENIKYRISIRINLENISAHHLVVDDKVILLGGTKVDVSKLYKSSLKAMQLQEEKFEKYRLLNRKLQKQLKTQKEKIALLRDEIEHKKQEYLDVLSLIEKKEKFIDMQEKKIKEREKQLAQLQEDYKYSKKKLQEQQTLLNNQANKFAKTKENIEKYSLVLQKKLQKIQVLDTKITQQEAVIAQEQKQRKKQANQIHKQNVTLYLLFFIALLLLLFIIYFYTNKKELERLNKALYKAKNEAEYANKSKSVFLANMSHELRTPLNAILGFSELLIEDKKLDKSYKKTVEIIYNSGSFLLTLINDILDIARIESGKTVVESKPVNIQHIIDDVVILLQSRAEAKQLHIHKEYQGELLGCVLLDEKKMRQILINHITNAIKYSSQGEIRVVVSMKNDKLYCTIEDQGNGIAQCDLETIFEPFEQVGTASSDTGSGLGLTISKQFVEAMGGTISVQSELGVGSSFHITIPYTLCNKDDVVVKREVLNFKKVVGVSSDTSHLKILIVEDKENNVILLQKVLEIFSCDIAIARNGEEAVALFQSFKPDLIWMDRRMPKMNGEEATKIIRSLDGGKDVIIIALTASATAEDKKRLQEVGIDDYAIKPYKFQEIYALMAKYFSITYLYEENRSDIQEKKNKQTYYSFTRLKVHLETLSETMLESLYNSAVLLNKEDMKEILEKIYSIDKDLYKLLNEAIENLNYMDILQGIEAVKHKRKG